MRLIHINTPYGVFIVIVYVRSGSKITITYCTYLLTIKSGEKQWKSCSNHMRIA